MKQIQLCIENKQDGLNQKDSQSDEDQDLVSQKHLSTRIISLQWMELKRCEH